MHCIGTYDLLALTPRYINELVTFSYNKLEEKIHAGNTTYTADSHLNSTEPRQGNNMNVIGYKNTEDTQKQTNIY